ncbi:MAG: aminotransferase class III-fold pyridoxal phosphate-dependent enzyme [Clostridiales Family XIII bacterium]|jgi:taurine--2-oxoglutarate transaminase|nr:aminotransferase class III-fold pyridoxal phosphate-dependent enzyme [Clostridiales Family XIII bacterium]
MSKISEMSKKYNLHSWSAQGGLNPMTVSRAEGVYFWDDEGNRYYDMSSQLVNSNLGHGNRAIIEAIKAQAEKLAFIGPGYAVDVRSEAARRLVEFAGPAFEGGKVFFTNAGAEANENAIKMAKAFTGRWKVFSMYRSYHGATFGASSLCGEPRRWIAEPGVPGFVHFDGPYAYRAPKACGFASEDDISCFYLELLENQIRYEDPGAIAAVFVETVVGSNGVLIPPKGYLRGVQEICGRHGIMLVCDEVMTGFYRTGSRFAFMQFDVRPDIISFAKGSTCGYVPLGGAIARKEIADFFDDRKMLCGLTYSAHPIGCAAALAAMDEYDRLGVEENVRRQGALLGELLDGLEGRHACLGEARHIGLFAMLELVRDKASREPIVPFNSDPGGLMPRIMGMLKSEGFASYSHENMIIVAPPLTIGAEELKAAIDILDRTLGSVDAMLA